MIRTILVLIEVILFLVLGSPLLLMELILGKINPDLRDRTSLALVNWVFGCIIRTAGVKTIVRGEERIPKDTAVLYVGNHRSYFDIILTYVRVPRPTGYVAKKEMLRYPILRVWMRNLHCLFLDRENIKEGLKTILAAVELVKSGISVTIFPEGTRNKVPDTFLPFHDGSFKIAEKGGVPIVPITIVNSGAVLEDHMPYIKKTTVVIEYGEPIYPDQLDKETRKHLGAYVSGIIQKTYFENKKLLQKS